MAILLALWAAVCLPAAAFPSHAACARDVGKCDEFLKAAQGELDSAKSPQERRKVIAA